MQKNRLVMILVVLVIFVVGGFTLIATNDQGINDASANESLAVNESSSGGLGFFNFGQKQRKQVEIDADGANETLDNIARDSADIKSRFRGVEENAAASERRFEQTDALNHPPRDLGPNLLEPRLSGLRSVHAIGLLLRL